MSFRTTLILFVLAVAVTWAVDALEGHRMGRFVSPSNTFDMLVRTIDRIEIERRTQKIVLVKEADSWRLEEPIRFPALDPAVRVLALDIRQMQVVGDGDPRKLDEYGLTDPEIRVRFENERGIGRGKHEIVIGKRHPRGYEYFALVDERPVLVKADFRDGLARASVDSLRSRTVMGISRYDANHVTIESLDRSVVLAREPEGWRVERPSSGRADSVRVEALVDTLNNWEIIEFVPAADDQGFDKPRFRVTVRSEVAEETLEIGGDGPAGPAGERRVYLRWSGQPFVFLVDAEPLTPLASPATEFRARDLLRLADPAITSIEITAEDGSCELLAGARGEWALRTDGQLFAAESGWVQGMIDSLRGDCVEEFLPAETDQLQKYGFDRPRLKIVVQPREGEAQTLLVGGLIPDQGGLSYVRNLEWDYFATAHLAGATVALRAPYSLRGLGVFRTPALRQVIVETAEGVTERFVRPHLTWKRHGAARQEIPEAKLPLERFVDLIGDLRAEAWEKPAEGAPGPDDFFMKVRVEPIEGQSHPFEAREFYVGRSVGGVRRILDVSTGWVFKVRLPARRDVFDLMHYTIGELNR